MCLTANHRNTSFEMLEKLSIGAPRAAGILVSDSVAISGAVVLATCNRFEAYLEIDDSLAADSAAAMENSMQVIGLASGVDAEELRSSVTVLSGTDVAEHLFAVSSGLESVIVGEDEISGQVRRSLAQARIAGTTSSGLERLFQKAANTSREVKSQTAVGGAGRSLVRLGLELASSRIVDWSSSRVLIVGTGQYAATTVAALRDRGAEDLTVFSPSGRAAKFALRLGLTASTNLVTALAAADVVITCTASEAPVVSAAHLVAGDRRIVIDLGLPRNVDPDVSTITGIELLDLETISLHAPLEELSATRDARALVSSVASEFAASTTEQQLTPAIVALRSHVFGLLEAEITRAHSRGDEDGRIEAALRHLTGVLLHTPSVRARELARAGDGQSFSDAVTALFGIDAVSETATQLTRDNLSA
ncbi:glutamyl-tRNA reductase [Frigoribacterium sp. CG_9.8]|nr:glutamyl-tRNA reductase [Frigoribacterium sp. CG_9.8]MBG6108731.1 glutamyl-tRNA reductase [Frigoribacterium sp. CG_9.8]